jgi:hypothetical protein
MQRYLLLCKCYLNALIGAQVKKSKNRDESEVYTEAGEKEREVMHVRNQRFACGHVVSVEAWR